MPYRPNLVFLLAWLVVGSAPAHAQTVSPTPTVTATPRLVALTLSPATAKRTVGQTQNFTTTGTFSDGSTKNLTQAVTYASSDPAVALCPNAAGNRGQVQAVGPGVAAISATDAATSITSTASQGDAVLTVVVAPTPTGPTPTRTPSPTPTVTPQIAHLEDGAAARTAVTCQDAIAKYAVRFVIRRLSVLSRCADGVFRCVERPGSLDSCLPQARDSCAGAGNRSTIAEARLRSRIVENCGSVGADTLLAEAGLGYDALAATCQDEFAIQIPDTAGLAQCVVDQHACGAMKLLAVEEPRAGQLMALIGDPLDTGLCLPNLGGADTNSQAGPSLLRCALSVKRVASRMVAKRLGGLVRCARSAFECAQIKPRDEGCLVRARARCDRVATRIETDSAALGPPIADDCGGIDFALLRSPAGANLDALATECAARGVADLTTLGDYQLCLFRHHACIAQDLLRFASPRAEEMLALLGRDPRPAFCDL